MYPILKEIRTRRDKSQREIAGILETTQQQYSKYEKGIQEIPARHLITLANYYDVSIDYLLGQTDDPRRKYKKS